MTRTDCECIICKVAHANLYEKVDVSEYTEIVRPTAKSGDSLCPKCYSPKGTEHKCTSKKESIDNLRQKMPQKLQEQLSSKVIKDKVSVSGSKGTELSTFGKPLTVSVGIESVASTSNQKSISHDSIISMQRDMKLSDKKTLKMAKHIRDET